MDILENKFYSYSNQYSLKNETRKVFNSVSEWWNSHVVHVFVLEHSCENTHAHTNHGALIEPPINV